MHSNTNAAGFSTPLDALPGAYGYNAGGWRVDQHLRLLEDVNFDQRADIVGFGNGGVSVALGQQDGSFGQPSDVITGRFGYDDEAGGWRVDRHPRMLADVNGDGRRDIVGFGNGGVGVALGNGDGTFREPIDALVGAFGYEAGGWRLDKHVRVLADVNGDHRDDIVGFGDEDVWVSLAQPNGTFTAPFIALRNDFAYASNPRQWRVDRHPRMLFYRGVGGPAASGVRGTIVGFWETGVSVALGVVDGTFQPGNFLETLRHKFSNDTGWRVDRHPRMLADVDGDGFRRDIVGFGNGGVGVALGNGDGTFREPIDALVGAFGYEAGGWRLDKHVRVLADVNHDRRDDIVGFGDEDVWVSLAQPNGTFTAPFIALRNDFAYASNPRQWRVDRHPRALADVNGDRCADIVGFWETGVSVALAQCN